MTFNWTHELSQQLDWHWHAQARPRLSGLTDTEYFWEPTPDAGTFDRVERAARR